MFNRTKQKSSSPKSPMSTHDRMNRYWAWRGLWHSHYTIKQDVIGNLNENRRRVLYLKKQIVFHYFRNFFLFPLFLFKFLTPSYLKGEVTLLSNIRTILKEKEFHPLRIAILSQFIFLFFFIQFSITLVHYYSSSLFSATYAFIQTSWGGGASTTLYASHSSDQTGWNMFYSTSSADVNTSVTGEVSLSPSLNATTQTSNSDFSTWATSSVFASSTGRIVLLKPVGAICNQASECRSGLSCTGGVCYEPPCTGSNWSVSYSGVSYPLVLIGTQCWFAANLNVGTMLASGATMPSNNSLIEKWCYDNSSANCTTYGGLYTWAEANQLATTCDTNSCTPSSPSQGICPSGWHIPTDAQFKTLEVYLGMCTGAGTGCVDAINQIRGATPGVGTKLKSGGTSGFNMLLAGDRSYQSNGFNNLGSSGWYWGAAEQVDATRGWYRQPSSGAGIYLGQINKTLGASVRCLLN